MSKKDEIWIFHGKVSDKEGYRTAISWDGPPSSAYVKYVKASALVALEAENKRLREALDGLQSFYPRFWSKVSVKKKNECWDWQSSISPNGYGKFSIDNYPHSAHVLSYKYFNSDFDSNLCIDHICMNRKCVNPNHLRQVTRAINNTENAGGTAAINKQKTHCSRGHEFSKENTQIKKGKSGTYRRCKVCEYAGKRARAALKGGG